MVISSYLHVVRLVRRPTRRGGYLQDDREWGERQELRRTYCLWGIPIWSTVIDSEEVPQHAVIQLGCLGYTEWRSKFADMEGVQWK